MTTNTIAANCVCQECGVSFTRKKTGPAPTYCSATCRAKAGTRRSKEDGRYEAALQRRRAATVERQQKADPRPCDQCGEEFQPRQQRSRFCSAKCNRNAHRDRDEPCVEPGCQRPQRARGLCALDWKRKYGKRRKAIKPCAVCGAEVEKDANTKRRSVCSYICRAYLEHGIWPRCDIPKRHAARGYVPPERRPRPEPTQRPCLWCGTDFTTSRSRTLYCTETCSAKAKRMRRRGREAEAGGTYTWTEVIALFLKFDRCCAYCRQEIEGQPEPDHVVALSRGGSNSITNILPSCSLCNSDKRDLLLHEWALDRERRHLPPRITEWRRGDPLYIHLAIVQEHERAA